MAERVKKPTGPRFNFMWFWAIVTIGLIYVAIFGEEKERPLEGDWEMVTGLVENGLIERIDVVDQEKASVYLKKELVDSLLKDERFKGMPTATTRRFLTSVPPTSWLTPFKSSEGIPIWTLTCSMP